MDFGKVPEWQLGRIDFALPPQDTRNMRRLARPAAARRVYVGAPVWSCPEWVGKIYPAGTPSRDFLRVYSRQFNSIELNSTFYAVPEARVIEGWRKAVPPEFRFFPKVSQAISHQFDTPPQAVRGFFEVMKEFGENLGMCFLQLPPGFAPQWLGVLRKWIAVAGVPLAVEFRHPAWFEGRRLIQPAYELLSEWGCTALVTDSAGRRDVVHGALTSPRAMVRFVGNELHETDYSRLDAWVERIGEWFDAGLEELDFFVHHPTFVNVPELGLYLVEKLGARLGVQITPPKFEPQQMGLF